MSKKTRIKLKAYNAKEKMGNQYHIQINDFSISDFNLLIGDNAQGKTRLLRMLNYISSLFTGRPRAIATTLETTFRFDQISGKERHQITYKLHVQPQNGRNIFKEIIVKNGKKIFSTAEKLLYDETESKNIKEFFFPRDRPAILSIDDPKFATIKLIREFFQRVIYISSSKNRDLIMASDEVVPNSEGTNVNWVLNNW